MPQVLRQSQRVLRDVEMKLSAAPELKSSLVCADGVDEERTQIE